MPIENERKFVLLDDGRLEQQLEHVPGVTQKLPSQAYLDVSGMRIRSLEADGKKRYVFTYKREVDGQVVEIETDINLEDFDRLWSQRRETLQKARYSWNDDRFHWDVDFFKTAGAAPTSPRPRSRCRKTTRRRRHCRRGWPVIFWRWCRPATNASPPSGSPTRRMPSGCWPTFARRER